MKQLAVWSAVLLLSATLLIGPMFKVSARSGIGAKVGIDPVSSLNLESRRDLMNLQRKLKMESQLHPSKRPDKRAWLLEPRLFNLLSPAGQRAVMIDNGLLPIPPTQQPRSLQRSRIAAQSVAPGQNVQANDPLADITGHTQSETSIATNGTTIVESFNDTSIGFGSGYAVSTDGGSSFIQNETPTQSAGFNIGDPVLSVGPGGEYYHSQIAQAGFAGTSTGESIVEVSKSTDGGVTFAVPVDASTTVANENDQQDKPWNTTDRGASSPFKGNIYVSWTDFSFRSGITILMARSTDGGLSFQPPISISPLSLNAAVQGSMPAVAPNGNLYIAYIDFATSPLPSIKVAESTDGGVHFSAPKVAATLNTVGEMTGANGVRANSFPAIAIGSDGTIHIVYDAAPVANGPDRSDVFYVRSTDGGSTFSMPARLNDDQTTTTQMFPSVAVAGDGTVGVKWWDRRNDPQNDSLVDVYMTTSKDGGATFGKNFRITDQNWTYSPIEPGLASAYHGDYDGIAASGNNFYLSWSDERNGNPDAFFAFVPDTFGTAPDFVIAATSVIQNVAQGGSVTCGLSTNAANAFSGNLALSASPSIPGVTYNFASSSVAAGSSGSLTIAAGPDAHPGTYPINVQASGGGLTRSTNFRLTVYRSGAIGSAPQNLSRSSGFSSTQNGFKTDQSGMIHLVYDDDTAVAAGASQVLYRRSGDGGATYSDPVLISTNSGSSGQSTLAIDSAGNLLVTYLTLDPESGNLQAFLSRSTDHGATFSKPVDFSPASDFAELPIAVAGKNGIVAAYVQETVSSSNLVVTRSSDGGRTFSGPVKVSGSAENVDLFTTSIGVDSRGAVYIVYNAAPKSFEEVEVVVANDGVNFSAPIAVSDPTTESFDPTLTVDSSDGIFLAFSELIIAGNAQFQIGMAHSCDHGASFSPSVIVSNTTGDADLPAVASDGRGGVAVAWEDTTGNRQLDIFAARSSDGGATFEPASNISANFGLSQEPAVTLDSTGNFLVAWTDDSWEDTEVVSSKVSMLPTGSPGFTLVPLLPEISIVPGSKGVFNLLIGRTGGFSGNVTVTPPDTSAVKLKLKPASAATTCGSVAFSFKSKGSSPGITPLVFTASDSAGHTATATIQLVVKPSQ